MFFDEKVNAIGKQIDVYSWEDSSDRDKQMMVFDIAEKNHIDIKDDEIIDIIDNIEDAAQYFLNSI